jgi:hypothetical protein
LEKIHASKIPKKNFLPRFMESGGIGQLGSECIDFTKLVIFKIDGIKLASVTA